MSNAATRAAVGSEMPDLTQELLAGSDTELAPEHIRRVFEQYGERMTAGDTDGIMALFAQDAVIRDPVTGPERRGHDEIRRFYQDSFDTMGGAIDMRLDGAVRIVGNYGAAAYIARTTSHETVYRSETLDVMTFNDAGLITSMMAYWGPANFSLDADHHA